MRVSGCGAAGWTDRCVQSLNFPCLLSACLVSICSDARCSPAAGVRVTIFSVFLDFHSQYNRRPFSKSVLEIIDGNPKAFDAIILDSRVGPLKHQF
jgi:hypothetical protein